jgi:signal transduction histidine kinase
VDKAKALSAHIDSTIQTVRRIATELRPGVLDHLGLVAALEWQANEFQNRTGIRCEVHTNLREPLLDSNLSTTFFRIFQETLTNIIRHAGATQVSVDLRQDGNRMVLEVRDNGRGISRDEIAKTNSMGLIGMRERASLLGGLFKIGKVLKGHGTRVKVSIPLPASSTTEDSNYENSTRRRSRRSAARAQANYR